jgi:hypothetical protein
VHGVYCTWTGYRLYNAFFENLQRVTGFIEFKKSHSMVTEHLLILGTAVEYAFSMQYLAGTLEWNGNK